MPMSRPHFSWSKFLGNLKIQETLPFGIWNWSPIPQIGRDFEKHVFAVLRCKSSNVYMVLHMKMPMGSMYGIFTYIYNKNQPNVGKLHLP